MVPDNFNARLWDRESKGTVGEVRDTVAPINQLSLTSGFLDLVINRLWVTNRTLSLVDRHFEGFRITLEHSNLTRSQVFLMLLIVLRSDHHLRLLAFEGVFVKVVCQRLTGISRQTTRPFRDSAGRVTGLLCADRRQRITQLINLGLGQALRHDT